MKWENKQILIYIIIAVIFFLIAISLFMIFFKKDINKKAIERFKPNLEETFNEDKTKSLE